MSAGTLFKNQVNHVFFAKLIAFVMLTYSEPPFSLLALPLSSLIKIEVAG